MCSLRVAALLTAVLLGWPRSGAAEEGALSLEQALELARERAPAIAASRARVDEARARLAGAAVLLRENPVVEGGGGLRWSPTGPPTAATRLGLGQTLELGGRRGARIAAAQAGVDHASVEVEDVTRHVMRDTAIAFYRALYAEERLRLFSLVQELAAETARVAERRHQEGDVPRLEANLARASLSRTRADVLAARSLQDAALGELCLLLGLEAGAPLAVQGRLGERRTFQPEQLFARAAERPDLRALQAEVRGAEAEGRLAAASAWPELTVKAAYEGQDGENVGLGLLALTLPVFERGQGARAEAQARSRRLGGELQAARQAAAVEIRTAFDVYRRRVEAAEELERHAIPLMDENESLARRGYEEGQVGLGELLIVRREALDTRLEHLERLLEAAVAGVELETSAGTLK